MSLTPYVIEDTGRGERSMDIFSRLLKDRIIFIGTEISDQVANVVVAQLLFLKMEDPKKDVNLYINSPGGQITAGLAILDTMLFLGCDINTYCIGQAVSMAALLLAAGTKGKRFALPHSRVMLHQPYGGVMGTSEDIALQAKEILELKKITSSLMSRFTGQSIERILEDSERDFYMDPQAAQRYGIVDHIAEPSHLNSVSEKKSELPASV
ncbi:MAG: ATP-dependent Clp protease proteolytic subunit [Chlamydiae bacterium RIFCSPHIGHO2_12_FULL_44_59]|nr:MAG: ATP-dependent Clp protease proteolytic subunit [Chlamydiae bacterium RIFCSPHIGHO2_01_FULL_44_39]OGN56470.1 MAG: ATP-dependent Clp protease proteolytic subunit [Chlamydiae bacterium RIFCSPHIGHO2_02_FULL_45_9]OGN60329.1 MAG: ATP-dependent Clp protease proteolytic subunit [Chlamydiae bacterium RIFCSPHIGHO2_12_FULL_44_59]OGN66312.1 MAG: ATP-dependent Clp protease proteolytic subunit [Chlamydiae bacterium RIFCSPLOWO2_01_FULL_44_52]OGN69263.1 MAG: ATP-dependent Clp protease proteolytic subuni